MTITVRTTDGHRHTITDVTGFIKTSFPEGWKFLMQDGSSEWFAASIVAAVAE